MRYVFLNNTGDAAENPDYVTVDVDGASFCTGPLHQYCFIQETLDEANQYSIASKPLNWVSNNEPNLYLFLTEEDHEISVNGGDPIVALSASYRKHPAMRLGHSGLVHMMTRRFFENAAPQKDTEQKNKKIPVEVNAFTGILSHIGCEFGALSRICSRRGWPRRGSRGSRR